MQNKHLSYTWNTQNKHFIIASQGIFPSIQSSRSRSLPYGGPNLGKPLSLSPHLAPQMAGRPCPMFYYSLLIAASVVVIPTTRGWSLQEDYRRPGGGEKKGYQDPLCQSTPSCVSFFLSDIVHFLSYFCTYSFCAFQEESPNQFEEDLQNFGGL